jgi:hypothetical protein
MRARLLAAVVVGWAGGFDPAVGDAAEPDAPSGWELVYDYLVQDACVDAAGGIVPGASPLDGVARCPRHRDLRVGERLPYHKHDWASVAERARLPDGYQRSDAFPIRAARLGVAVVQSFDFGDPPRAFARFDPGDGGQIAVFSPRSVAYGVTEDGGGGLQFFYGAGCAAAGSVARLYDSWIVVDRSFVPGRPGETLARLAREPARCPDRLGYALTRWHERTLSLRVRSGGRETRQAFELLVSDHFGGRDPALANHLERFYFARALGLVRWERWENLARPGDPAPRAGVEARAATLAASDRCEAVAEPPASTGRWLMADCRQWTNLVPAREPAGDPTDVWLARLRRYDASADLFAE